MRSAGRPLRVLLVEDSPDDELLVLRELKRGGYDVRHLRVQTAEDMRDALASTQWDVVISDYSLPHFSGPAALAVLRQSGVDLPFIMTSGTVDEETAVEALHAGAHDFMVKSRLTRLVPAIQREVQDHEARRARQQAEIQVRQLEEQVRQAQKMEAIGRLAGGVAHDFNNILTAILATADLALMAPGLAPELRDDLESIREAGIRAAGITRQLLTFSRKQVVQARPIDPSDVTSRMETLLRRLLRDAATLEVRTASSGLVEADPSQLEQVLMNLVVNAADAMPNGGTVTVETSDFEAFQAANAQGGVLAPGKYVVIRVRDTGIGMDRDTIDRIFEPFFTTKEPGRGTGLGLATVYGVVKQFGGQIFVHSKPSQGTVFEVFLPIMDTTPSASIASSGEHSTAAGSEVVLMVEDEPAVRAPICRSLRKLGYFVIEAENGEDALAKLEEYHAPVHLLITDVVMPQMKGTELTELLHSWYPNMKVLFVSGYNEDFLTSQEGLPADALYLAKPFTPETLARRVRAILDEVASSGRD